MEKRKFDLSKYADMHQKVLVLGADKAEVYVRTNIPYEQKEAMAKEMAERIIMIHDESCVYTSSECAKIKMYMIAKYYTDIDTDGVDPAQIADFFINDRVIEPLIEQIDDDYDEVLEIFYDIVHSVKTTYEDDRSITKALRTSFGFLFNGEDVTESLAKAEAMKDTVYEAINAWRKVEKEKEEKIDNGRLSVGGNIINFAKKTE